MFGSALPSLVTLLSPLLVPAQLMVTGPNVRWQPTPATAPATAARPTAAAKPATPTAALSAPALARVAAARLALATAIAQAHSPIAQGLAGARHAAPTTAPRLPAGLAAAVIPPPNTVVHAAAQPPAKAAPATAKTASAVDPSKVVNGEPIRGLHVTGWIALMPKRMGEMIDFISNSPLNAVMIAIKDESGNRFWKTKTAGQKGPSTLAEQLKKCKQRGIYTACRFVCFKDTELEQQQPEFRFGAVNGDRRLAPWIDPGSPKAIAYLLKELDEVAGLGFDEINLDYVRYPDRLRTPIPLSQKCQVIGEFIRQAREVVKRHNVRLTVSVFGYVAWDEKKANVGQRLEDLYQNVDGVYFMVYPSHFAKGDLGFKDPSAHPYEVVRLGMDAAKRHFEQAPIDILPWVQVFSLKHDYRYGPREVLLQLKGALDGGVGGYWAWDPGVEYRALREAMPILAAQGYPQGDTSRWDKKQAEKILVADARPVTQTEAKSITQAEAMAISEARLRTTAPAAPAVRSTRSSTATKPAPKAKAGSDDLYSY